MTDRYSTTSYKSNADGLESDHDLRFDIKQVISVVQ